MIEEKHKVKIQSNKIYKEKKNKKIENRNIKENRIETKTFEKCRLSEEKGG